ncbi:MAG: uracil phosphoribosyltransferase [Myxococcales bacterium]|nr:MAG: uracil phosphoribosyltransferase [Myxococcales bacterium]
MDTARDIQYSSLPYIRSEMEHEYGENVHILSSPVLMTLLAKLCAKGTIQPEANRLIAELYMDMLKVVVNAEFPRSEAVVPSRMIEQTPRGVYVGEVVSARAKVAVAAVARAGILPSQVVFDGLNLLLNPEHVREDCFFVSRAVDAEHRVTGANVASSKIGGPLDDRLLLLPDPMGATGSSLLQTLDTYVENKVGKPRKAIAMHLIVTPEYLRNVTHRRPEIIVYAIRLDRGLSSPDVLATKPGTRWEEERGLNEVHYIVPGGGGLGEVMTNSWV